MSFVMSWHITSHLFWCQTNMYFEFNSSLKWVYVVGDFNIIFNTIQQLIEFSKVLAVDRKRLIEISSYLISFWRLSNGLFFSKHWKSRFIIMCQNQQITLNFILYQINVLFDWMWCPQNTKNSFNNQKPYLSNITLKRPLKFCLPTTTSSSENFGSYSKLIDK